MPLIITGVSYLQMCHSCHEHGYIVYANGAKSDIFVTRRSAEKALETGKNWLSDAETKAIKSAIETSGMPYWDADMEGLEDLFNMGDYPGFEETGFFSWFGLDRDYGFCPN